VSTWQETRVANHWPVLLELLETAGLRLHVLLVRLTLREHVAEDLLQDLFVRLARADGFAAATDRAAFAARAAIHLAFDWRRARQRRGILAPLDPELPAEEHSPLLSLVQREELDQVLDAANGLSEQSRDVFVLHYIGQQSYEQIAALMGKTPQQVRGLAYKAVLGIRAQLGGTPQLTRTEAFHADDE
jgi:RNA polymerase sigma-70 factor (ECF subfamily)